MSSKNRDDHQQSSAPGAREKSSISMHEDVPVWYDCCSCEAEPYWLEAFDQARDNTGSKITRPVED